MKLVVDINDGFNRDNNIGSVALYSDSGSLLDVLDVTFGGLQLVAALSCAACETQWGLALGVPRSREFGRSYPYPRTPFFPDSSPETVVVDSIDQVFENIERVRTS